MLINNIWAQISGKPQYDRVRSVSYRTEVSERVLEFMKPLLQVQTLIPAAGDCVRRHSTYKHTPLSTNTTQTHLEEITLAFLQSRCYVCGDCVLMKRQTNWFPFIWLNQSANDLHIHYKASTSDGESTTVWSDIIQTVSIRQPMTLQDSFFMINRLKVNVCFNQRDCCYRNRTCGTDYTTYNHNMCCCLQSAKNKFFCEKHWFSQDTCLQSFVVVIVM